MHPQLDPKNLKVFVSGHAKQRFLERFRKIFRRSLEQFSIDTLIRAEISQGAVCTQWLQCPFYVNKQGTTHGKSVIVIWRKPCYYVCVLNNKNNYVVKTVVPHWQGENRT